MLKDLLSRLCITEYPENFEDFRGKTPPVSILDKGNIKSLEERFGVFSEYTEKLISAIDYLWQSKELVDYADTSLSYLYACKSRSEAAKLKLPEFSESSLLRFYPMLMLAALLPKGIEEYRRRGFSDAEIYENLHGTFGARVAMSERLTGLIGLDKAGFSWLSLYCYADVFKAGVFNVTPKFLPDDVIVLKNRKTLEHALLVTAGEFHKSGKALGNKEYTDTDGAFTASFSEDCENFVGYPCINSRVSPCPVSYKKTEWSVVLKKGDGVAGIHIPRGADLSAEAMKKSFELALSLTRERYPEFSAVGIHCSTWMLDPRLKELLGENSRLLGFLNSFEKYPRRCPGDAVFSFVFDGKPKNLEDLAESTSLQRKIKNIYLSGGAINVHGGVICSV